MNVEKRLKIATVKLESRKTHRIDKLRAWAKMNRETFDQAILNLARDQKIELVGGDTSNMTEQEIKDLIQIDDMLFVNIIWLMPIPARAKARKRR